MRNTIKKILFQSFVPVFLIVLIAFLHSACNKDSDAEPTVGFTGTWSQKSRTIDGAAATKDSTRLVLQLNANNICVMTDSTASAIKAKRIIVRSGYSYHGGLLNIATDIPVSWTVNATESNLQLERIDFNKQGQLTRTLIEFSRIADLTLN